MRMKSLNTITKRMKRICAKKKVTRNNYIKQSVNYLNTAMKTKHLLEKFRRNQYIVCIYICTYVPYINTCYTLKNKIF